MKVDFHFDMLYRVEGLLEACSLAVPFEKGCCFSVDQFVVVVEGRTYLTQGKVTSYWEDSSVRWGFFYFLVDLPGNRGLDCILTDEVKVVGQCVEALAVKIEDKVCVDNGRISFEVRDSGDSLFYQMGLDECSDVCWSDDFVKGPSLCVENKGESPLRIERWDVIENGAVCSVLEGTGSHVIGDYSYQVIVRLTVHAGKPWVEMGYRLFNTSKEAITIDQLSFVIPIQDKVNKIGRAHV